MFFFMAIKNLKVTFDLSVSSVSSDPLNTAVVLVSLSMVLKISLLLLFPVHGAESHTHTLQHIQTQTSTHGFSAALLKAK